MLLDLVVFIFGLAIGSFLNVAIYRIPENISLVKPDSYCFSCNSSLKPHDLIPIVSWLILKGHCRYCHAKISIRYLFVELSTAILFVFLFRELALGIEFLRSLIFVSFLIVITAIDLKHQLIFDRVLATFALTMLLTNALFPYLADYYGLLMLRVDFLDLLWGFLVGGGALLTISIISGGLGGGDIKLMAVLGLCLGLNLTILTLFLSFIIGGVYGTVALIIRKHTRGDYIAFAPFISIAAIISYLYGHEIIRWYFFWAGYIS